MTLSGGLFLETKFAYAVNDFLEDYEKYKEIQDFKKAAEDYTLIGEKLNARRLLEKICNGEYQEFFNEMKYCLIRFR